MPTSFAKANLLAEISLTNKNMILYKPTNQFFRNRLEAKLALGHSRYNKIAKKYPDDLIYLNDNSLASDEQLYSNSKLNYRTNKEK